MSPEAPLDPLPQPPRDGGPEADVLDAVRSAAAEVARRAEVVHLVADRLGPYAAELVADRACSTREPTRADDPWTAPGDDPEAVAGRVLALDTINFGSGWHPVVRKHLGRSGAVNMANGLTGLAGHRRRGAARARWPTSTPTRPTRSSTSPTTTGPSTSSWRLFTVALNDLGHLVLDAHDGSFTALVEAADGSAATLVDLLAEMPFFRDVSTYDDIDVPLYKRAQITSADLHRAFGGRRASAASTTSTASPPSPTTWCPTCCASTACSPSTTTCVARIEPASCSGRRVARGGRDPRPRRARRRGAADGAGRARAATCPRGTSTRCSGERAAGPRYKAVPRHRARSVFY